MVSYRERGDGVMPEHLFVTRVLFLALMMIMTLRKYQNALRFEGFISKRTQPPPNICPGPHHRLSENYYYTRDGRRECMPPVVVYDSTREIISAGDAAGRQESSDRKSPPIPGFGYNWTTGQEMFKPRQ